MMSLFPAIRGNMHSASISTPNDFLSTKNCSSGRN